MIRGLFTRLVMGITTILCGGASAVVTTLRPSSDAVMVAGRVWSRINLWASGARIEWRGLDVMRRRLPCIYVSNHQSNVDIWALIAVLPKQTRFVAKQSLFRVPVLGWALRVSGFVPIDRTNRARAIRSLEVAAERIRGGRPLVLFAEGTRTAGDALEPFKKGPFHLALAAGVPIVPIAISGSGKVMPPDRLAVRPGPVRVRFCEPVEVDPFLPSDVRGLLEAVRSRIESAIAEDGAAARGSTLAAGSGVAGEQATEVGDRR